MSDHHSTRSSILSRASDAVRHSFHSVSENIASGTIMATTLNTLCNVIGAGVLSLPLGMYDGSLIPSIILLILCGAGSVCSTYIMVKACDHTRSYTFADVMAYAIFPRKNVAEDEDDEDENPHALNKEEDDVDPDEAKRKGVHFFMSMVVMLLNYLAVTVYGKVVSISIPPVIKDFLHGDGVWIEQWFWLAIPGVLFFILSCAKQMEELKWSSLMGFITIFYIVIMVIVRYFTKHHEGTTGEDEVYYWDLTIATLKAMPTFGSAFCYHYNIPYFYGELKDRSPRRMMISVSMSMPLTLFCYLATGILGYLTFGRAVGSKDAGGDIVSNYSDYDTAINIGRLGLFFHFASVYPILAVAARRGLHVLVRKLRYLYACHQASQYVANGDEKSELLMTKPVEDLHEIDPKTRLGIALEAFCVVATSLVLAAFVPGIGILIQFIGSIFGLFLMFIGPGIIGVRVFTQARARAEKKSFAVKDSYGWVIISYVLAIAGTFFSVTSLYSIIDGLVKKGK